jgi:hypothetical protein
VGAARDAALAAVAGHASGGQAAQLGAISAAQQDEGSTAASETAGTGTEEARSGARAGAPAKPLTLRRVLWEAVTHVLRAAAAACLMLAVMWIMGLFPGTVCSRCCVVAIHVVLQGASCWLPAAQ